jgi:hypothetical protein
VQKLVNFFAHIARLLLHIIVLFIICRKLWPGQLMSTPLGTLTLRELLGGLMGLVGTLMFVCVIVYNLFNPERPDERERDWGTNWLGAFGGFALLVGLAVYDPPPTKDGTIEAIHGFAAGIVFWLLS